MIHYPISNHILQLLYIIINIFKNIKFQKFTNRDERVMIVLHLKTKNQIISAVTFFHGTKWIWHMTRTSQKMNNNDIRFFTCRFLRANLLFHYLHISRSLRCARFAHGSCIFTDKRESRFFKSVTRDLSVLV